ncbi:DUF4214 domain-containing protein [Mameliella alba]|nr:DUF4214 domain-containing protein [Mameliella alba]
MSNTFSASPQVKTGKAAMQSAAQPLPDLVLADGYVAVEGEVGPTGGMIFYGDFLHSGGTIANQGDVDAPPFTFGIYLSPDPEVTADDLLIGYWSYTGYQNVIDTSHFEHFTGPPIEIDYDALGLQPGTYYIALLADPENEIAESDETNNASTPREVTVHEDQRITDFYVDLSFLAGDQAGPLDFVVFGGNLGNRPMQAFELRVYASGEDRMSPDAAEVAVLPGEVGGAQIYPFTFSPDQFRSFTADLYLFGWIVPGPFEEIIDNNLTEGHYVQPNYHTEGTRMFGDADDEYLIGSASGNYMNGAGGDDLVTGMAGTDVLVGGAGADVLRGGLDRDYLIGDERGLYGIEISAQIYRLYLAVFGREPDANGHQEWLTRLASGAMTHEAIAEAFMVSREFRDTYGDTDDLDFVGLLYLNVFNRVPTEEDAQAWVERMEAGMSRTAVVRHFAESPEHVTRTEAAQAAFDETLDPTTWADDVYRLYRAVFDRDPDYGGFSGWVEKLSNGWDFGGTVAFFVGSAEFQATYGDTTDAEFVTLLYNNVLDRDPDPGGFATWVGLLEDGASRVAVVRHFMDSPEFVENTGPALRDFMLGYGADDRLIPEGGGGVLSGGLFSDTFVFHYEQGGQHWITDWESWDRIELVGFDYADTAEALNHVTQEGEDAVFYDNGVRIIFMDRDVDSLTEDMFTLL